MKKRQSGVRLGATLGLPEAQSVHATLLAALDDAAATITVDCSAATAVDLSFIQLLLAAHRAAEFRRKSLSLSAPASGALLDALQRGGFLDGNAPEAERSFWLAAEIAA